MDDDRKSSLPPPSGVDAFGDDEKMPDGADLTLATTGTHTGTPGESKSLGPQDWQL